MALTRCQDSPTKRATAENGIWRANISTRASNSSVKPESLPTHGGSTSATRPSGNFTRGTRTDR